MRDSYSNKHTDSTIPLNINQEWMKNESYGLERLESNITNNNRNASNTDWMKDDDSYNLDTLYKKEESPPSTTNTITNTDI